MGSIYKENGHEKMFWLLQHCVPEGNTQYEAYHPIYIPIIPRERRQNETIFQSSKDSNALSFMCSLVFTRKKNLNQVTEQSKSRKGRDLPNTSSSSPPCFQIIDLLLEIHLLRHHFSKNKTEESKKGDLKVRPDQ